MANIIDTLDYEGKMYIYCPQGTTKEEMVSVVKNTHINHLEIRAFVNKDSSETYALTECEEPTVIITESKNDKTKAVIDISFGGSFSKRFTDNKFKDIEALIEKIPEGQVSDKIIDIYDSIYDFVKTGGTNIFKDYEDAIYDGSFDLSTFIRNEEMAEPFSSLTYKDEEVNLDFRFIDTYSGAEFVFDIPLTLAERAKALELFDKKINRDKITEIDYSHSNEEHDNALREHD